MKPTRRSLPGSMHVERRKPVGFRRAARLARANISGMRLPAPGGVITQRAGSFLKPADFGLCSTRSPTRDQTLDVVDARRHAQDHRHLETLGELVGVARSSRRLPANRPARAPARGRSGPRSANPARSATKTARRRRPPRSPGRRSRRSGSGSSAHRRRRSCRRASWQQKAREPASGGADGHFERHLLVHRPLGIEVGIGRRSLLEHLGRRRARDRRRRRAPRTPTRRGPRLRCRTSEAGWRRGGLPSGALQRPWCSFGTKGKN
jgi:hypothetical protein